MLNVATKKITSNPEIDQETWDRLKDRLEEIDPSRNYSDKHVAELALKLSDYLLDQKLGSMSTEITSIKRQISELENVVK